MWRDRLKRWPRLRSAVLPAICALALMLAAFAHKPFTLPAYAGVYLSDYVLPDGSFPVLCEVDIDGDGKPDGISGHCEFCRIAASVDLPSRQHHPQEAATPGDIRLML